MNRFNKLFDRAQNLIDKYQAAIGIILLLAIAGAGIAWLFGEKERMSEQTSVSQLSGEIKTLREQNEQLLAQLRQMQEKHNQLVENLTNQQMVDKRVAGAESSQSSLTSIQSGTDIQSGSEPAGGEINTQSGDNSASQSSQLININTAGLNQLDSLPGIGPVYAQRIIDYREANGGFKSKDELVNVKGIGPKTLEKIKDKIGI